MLPLFFVLCRKFFENFNYAGVKQFAENAFGMIFSGVFRETLVCCSASTDRLIEERQAGHEFLYVQFEHICERIDESLIKTAFALDAGKTCLWCHRGEAPLCDRGRLSKTRRQAEHFSVSRIDVFRNQRSAALVECDKPGIEQFDKVDD